MASKSVMICPKCNSSNISNDFSSPGLVGTGLFDSAKVCNNCGYRGDFFPVVDADKLPLVKEIKPDEKKDSINTAYGKYAAGFWKVSGPIVVVLSILLLVYPSSTARLMSILMAIPLAIVMIVSGYFHEWVEKHAYVRILLVALFFLGVVLSLLIVFFINPST
jgi:hypothetical protein